MFSYRHAFHAGNHADVLKHIVLLAVLRYMTQKDTALNVFDSHAGAGLYRLDGDYAKTSAEAAEGFLKLIANKPKEAFAPAIQDYVEMVAGFNHGGTWTVYPGSPFIIQSLLHGRDKLKLFELHPTDTKTLTANIAQLEAGRQVTILREDGFEGLKKFLPPPSRRALVLCDPSYEVKHDYARVQVMITDAMLRFPTGTYAVWYPIIPRPEAHDVPKKLKTLANKSGKSWLSVSLTVKNSKLTQDAEGEVIRPGLPASGVFLINPPHTLKALLKDAMPQLVAALGQDQHAAFVLESGG
jgi:23S rRNA (adenine2030-N6)-methyltransferase